MVVIAPNHHHNIKWRVNLRTHSAHGAHIESKRSRGSNALKEIAAQQKWKRNAGKAAEPFPKKSKKVTRHSSIYHFFCGIYHWYLTQTQPLLLAQDEEEKEKDDEDDDEEKKKEKKWVGKLELRKREERRSVEVAIPATAEYCCLNADSNQSAWMSNSDENKEGISTEKSVDDDSESSSGGSEED